VTGPQHFAAAREKDELVEIESLPSLGRKLVRLAGATYFRSSETDSARFRVEPDTEGRLVASLVRNAEGPAAIYFSAHDGLAAFVDGARRRRTAVSSVQAGPLGPSVVLLAGPTWGPHLIVVGRPPGGTIPT